MINTKNEKNSEHICTNRKTHKRLNHSKIVIVNKETSAFFLFVGVTDLFEIAKNAPAFFWPVCEDCFKAVFFYLKHYKGYEDDGDEDEDEDGDEDEDLR